MIRVFSRKITSVNRTKRSDKKNEWLVIHYVGATSTAENNADYFNSAYRGASATYFVDPTSIWQVVEESDNAWHVGGAKTYYNSCRNSNSIAIELCCRKKDGQWYIEPETIENAVELSAMVLYRNNIDIEHCIRHWDCTRKNCPEPLVRDPKAWKDFKTRVQKRLEEIKMAYDTENIPTEAEKEEEIKKYFGFDNNTIQFFRFYKYGQPLIDKLYYKAKNP